jgi:hypothetical protein
MFAEIVQPIGVTKRIGNRRGSIEQADDAIHFGGENIPRGLRPRGDVRQ